MSYSTDISKPTEQGVLARSPLVYYCPSDEPFFFTSQPNPAPERRMRKRAARLNKISRMVDRARDEMRKLFGYYYNISGKPNTSKFKVGKHNAYFVSYDADGDCDISNAIIPTIVDVQNINNKVVIVRFADDTVEKAILSDDDTFSLEQGISICITKKMLSKLTGGRGSSTYNKLVEHGLKVYGDKEKNTKKKADEEKAIKAAEQKKIEKARKKKAKRKAAKREEQILIQTEAIRRAMASMQDTPKAAE